MFKIYFFCFGTFYGISYVKCGSFECHDDSAYEPNEGPISELQFTWLGALQYIHMKNGNPHYFRVPRVSLITRQFVLSTAKDAAEVPSGYALGNVVFPEYERDEKECGLTIKQLAAGGSCDPAVLLMPIADVLLHPEYKHFGVKSSVALLKLLTPLGSNYMVPVCLPFRNFLLRPFKEYVEKLIYVDFISEVPRDFLEEEKELVFLRLVPRERCVKHEYFNESSLLPDRHVCTTGCDLQSGAPTLVHEHTGHWNLFALAEGIVEEFYFIPI
ncbi:PREDICTED: uncharacterized protein LOC106103203 [Papilio polytes]|uniref:uncharacterized protein LOC106103203 n=1 Tax=Papilio polytes TaxID=76194 RepID=UPI0006767FB1|nr:PREDICTED: uncharacterized protein LOC106103203 [Papilio polytes]